MLIKSFEPPAHQWRLVSYANIGTLVKAENNCLLIDRPINIFRPILSFKYLLSSNVYFLK